MTTELEGDPYADRVKIRDIIEGAESEEVQLITKDAKYLKFLREEA